MAKQIFEPERTNIVLIPEYWLWPDELHAVLKLLGAKAYDGIYRFDGLGFGHVKGFIMDKPPRVNAANTVELPRITTLPSGFTIHVVLPKGYVIDWSSYHEDVESYDGPMTQYTIM